MNFISGQINLNPGTSKESNMMFGPNIGHGGIEFKYNISKNYQFRISGDFGDALIPLKTK